MPFMPTYPQENVHNIKAISLIFWQLFCLLLIHNLELFKNFYDLLVQSKKISNDQELIQSDPISCPQNQKGNN